MNLRITIATPCYDETVTTHYLRSIVGFIQEASRKGVVVRLITIGKDSLITRARNNLVRIFLDDEESHYLLFVDSDIGFEPQTVWRLLAYDKDVTCAIYPKKDIIWPLVKKGVEEGVSLEGLQSYGLDYNITLVANTYIENGFVEVQEAATGFMLIKKRVLLKMKEAYPELKYIPENRHGSKDERFTSDNNYAFFDTMIEEKTKRYLSEDYTFCRRWQKLGGKVYADLTSRLTHTGVYTFKGDMTSRLSSCLKQK